MTACTICIFLWILTRKPQHDCISSECARVSVTGFQPANHREAMPAAIGALQRSGNQRNPQNGISLGNVKDRGRMPKIVHLRPSMWTFCRIAGSAPNSERQKSSRSKTTLLLPGFSASAGA